MISFILLFANTDTYKAASIDSGAANKSEMKVILMVPKIKASKPYRGFADTGTHSLVAIDLSADLLSSEPLPALTVYVSEELFIALAESPTNAFCSIVAD